MPLQCRIFKDSDNQQFGIQIIDKTTGVVQQTIDGMSSIYLTLDDISPDGTAREAKFQLLQWKDANSCVMMQAYVLMTTPEPVNP